MMIHAHIYMGHAPARLSRLTDGGKGAAASAASRAAKSKRSASSDSASSLSSSPSGGARSGHWPPLVPHSQPSRSSAPASGGGATALAAASPSRAVAAAAVARFTARSSAARIAFHRDEGGCQMLGQHEHPAPPGRLHHLPGRRATGGRQPSAQRFCNARPSGSFAVASTPPKGCSAAMGKGHHSYSLPTAAHRASRTWRHGVRHGERQEQGLGGAFPPPAGRVTETRGGTRGVQQDMKGVNRSLSPWRQNTPWAYP
jgi:hypothetical protein